MQRLKSKEQLKAQILKCFENRKDIAEDHQVIFDQDLESYVAEKLYSTYSCG